MATPQRSNNFNTWLAMMQQPPLPPEQGGATPPDEMAQMRADMLAEMQKKKDNTPAIFPADIRDGIAGNTKLLDYYLPRAIEEENKHHPRLLPNYKKGDAEEPLTNEYGQARPAYNETDMPGSPPPRVPPSQPAPTYQPGAQPPAQLNFQPPPMPLPGSTAVVASPGAAGGPHEAPPPASPLQAAGGIGSQQEGGPAKPTAPMPSLSPQTPLQAAGRPGIAPMDLLALNPKAMMSALQDLPEVGNGPYLKPPDIAKGEGRKTTATGEEKLSTSSKQVGAIAPNEFAQAVQNIIDAPTPGQKFQEKDVKNLRDALGALVGQDKARTPFQNADLSPLFNFYNQEFGKKLGYTPPQGQQNFNRELMAGLTKTLLSSEGHMSATDAALLKSQLLNVLTAGTQMNLSGKRETTAGVPISKGPNSDLPQKRFDETVRQHAQEQDDREQKQVTDLVNKRGPDTNALYGAFRDIDAILSKSKAKGEASPPGFYDLRETPGIGGMLDKLLPKDSGRGQLPNMLRYNEDSKELARLNDTLNVNLLHQYSGAEASNREVQRWARQVGSALDQGPSQYISALRHLVEAVRDANLERETSILPGAQKKLDTVDMHRSRDFNFTFGGPPLNPPAGKPEAKKPAAGATKASGKTADQLIEEYKAKKAQAGQ